MKYLLAIILTTLSAWLLAAFVAAAMDWCGIDHKGE